MIFFLIVFHVFFIFYFFGAVIFGLRFFLVFHEIINALLFISRI